MSIGWYKSSRKLGTKITDEEKIPITYNFIHCVTYSGMPKYTKTAPNPHQMSGWFLMFITTV